MIILGVAATSKLFALFLSATSGKPQNKVSAKVVTIALEGGAGGYNCH